MSTFTEKAAFQLQQGLRGLLGLASNHTGKQYDVSRMYVGTVHSLCQRILLDRRFSPGRRRGQIPAILDATDQYFFVYRRRNWQALLESAETSNEEINQFFARQSSKSRHRAVTSLIQLFNRLSEESIDPDDAIGRTRDRAFKKMLRAYRMYRTLLASPDGAKRVDLSLLQQAAFDRIRAFSGADAIFEHVIVDEYQDTNPIQEKLFFALTGKYKNLSYFAVSGEDEGPDPDGLDHAARMALESSAIDLILLHELWWERTPTHNPGYDLYEPSGDGATLRWCEVKTMTGTLDERPVGLSHTQFEYAQKHGENYWLYVVEHVGTSEARILRIQDPAGKARTFMFDRGWVQVANV